MPFRFVYLLLVFSFFVSPVFASINSIPNTVVACTADDCPIIAAILNPNEQLQNQAIVFQTSPQQEFLARSIKEFSDVNNDGWQHIIINETELIDTHPIVGFGGAFTDSAAMLYQHMLPPLKKALIDSYFSPQGLAYTLGRVPIASADFSCRKVVHIDKQVIGVPSLDNCSSFFSNYSYADKPDELLNNFSLQPEDLQFKIPMIRAAMQADPKTKLRLFASPWSAPAWMKTNGSMVHGSLIPKFQQVWANYFVKFLEAYKAQNIIFWGVTVQNEPVENGLGTDYQTWQTMFLTDIQEAELIKKYLGPTLKKFEKTYGSKIHLMMHDDQISTIQNRVAMVNDPDLAQYVDGAGLHWYSNFDFFFPNLDIAYQRLNNAGDTKKRFILGTEACQGYMPIARGPAFGSWARGESYGHDIISDINHHVSGWTDWNLILDMEGGPNWAKNNVDAPILFDLNKQTFYRQPMYYYLGHFSKFIRPGASLLASRSEGPAPLEQVSFKVPAYENLPETIVIVVLNRDFTSRDYYISDESITNGNKFLNMHIPAHAIQTIIYRVRV